MMSLRLWLRSWGSARRLRRCGAGGVDGEELVDFFGGVGVGDRHSPRLAIPALLIRIDMGPKSASIAATIAAQAASSVTEA